MKLDRTEADRLVADHAALAGMYANRAHRAAGRRGEYADYHASAMLGLWEATFRYRPELGASFATYAGYWMRVRARELAANEAARGCHVPDWKNRWGSTRLSVRSISAMQRTDDDRPFDVPARPEGSADMDAPDLWRAVDRLLPTRRQRLIVWLYYGCGLTDPEIAAAMGFTRARAQQLRTRAVAALRRNADKLKGYAV